MKKVNIAEGHQQIMPYFIVGGAGDFIEFLKNVFHGEVQYNMPRSEGVIMHAEVRIGTTTVMLADATDVFAPCTAGLFIYVDDADEVYGRALAAGATSIQAPSDQPYGRSAGVRDQWGNTWWVTTAA
jgi:PhnB protein